MFSIQTRLDETQIIDNIRRYGEQIFNMNARNDESFDFSISQSESSYHDRMIRPLIIQTNPKNEKRLVKSKLASDYQSPYSKKSTSFSFEERQRIANHRKIQNTSGEKIRRKIFEIYNEDKKIQTEKKQLKKISTSRKNSNVKSKYLQAEPVMKNLSGYIKQNIYGRMKTETEYIRKKNNISYEQRQKKWDDFIKKNEDWEAEKRRNIMKAKLQQNIDVSEEIKKRPIRKSPPKSDVDQCLKKLRRQADKLKQKLDQYTFEPKTYLTPLDLKNQQEKQKYTSPPKQKLKHLTFAIPEEGKTERKIPVLRDPTKQLNFIF